MREPHVRALLRSEACGPEYLARSGASWRGDAAQSLSCELLPSDRRRRTSAFNGVLATSLAADLAQPAILAGS